jgi:hypothetical protein
MNNKATSQSTLVTSESNNFNRTLLIDAPSKEKMAGLSRSRERCFLGLSGDIVHSAPKEQSWIAMTPEERNENQHAMSRNATLPTEKRHRDAAIAPLLTEFRFLPGYNTKPKREQASADTPQRSL